MKDKQTVEQAHWIGPQGEWHGFSGCHFAEIMRLMAEKELMEKGIFFIFEMMQLSELHLKNKFYF